ncbi:DUF4395 family protein [Sulfurimonas sp. HSL-3221]|uniref:DUF4395 family protein n=1 Tax=Sulfurimonadaceae TaxID=2771471 RepID=UPI001E2EF990|nr:DUF4395 family protein [Sulfurimonas sp. HSL-3221]UFS62504.1 DUF4395 family protein [Sulfurimonas sp. HSL-3221]
MKVNTTSGYGSDANQTRLRAAVVALAATMYLHTGSAVWLLLLALDYFVLLNATPWISPLALSARAATYMIRFGARRGDAAEKRFADQIKFGVTLGTLGTDLAGYANIAGLFAGAFAIWTAAEAVDDSCMGCALYRWLKRHEIEVVAL